MHTTGNVNNIMHVIYNYVDAPETYHCTFPAMIDDWREKWYAATMQQTDELFGFGFVQVHSELIDNKFESVICLLITTS